MKKYLAKSYGEDLEEHSKKVENVILKIAKIILKDFYFKKFEVVLKHFAFLHDIGKIIKPIQDYLSVGKDVKLDYSHNEISWAFISKYYKGEYKDVILYSVFWHHGISPHKKIEDINAYDILNSVAVEDLEGMKDFFRFFVGNEYFTEDNENWYLESPPPYYKKERENPYITMVLYSLLVSADRIASDGDIDKDLHSFFNLSKKYDPIKNWEFKNTKRGKRQISIIEQSDSCNTVMMNAPSGFGKTVLGLLWGLKKDKKIMWVCPRNSIAESVYLNVCSELKKMDIGVGVELVLSGEVKKGGNGKMFDSDIIITNIDNFLAPTNKNPLLKFFGLINCSSVIFDEFHEMIGDWALFSCFVNIMKGRNFLTNSDTLLLSATPNDINFLWDGSIFDSCETLILPNKYEHFEAQHDKKYNLKVSKVEDVPTCGGEKSLTVVHSVLNSQKQKGKGGYDRLVHGKFKDSKKEENLNYLFDNFGKNSDYCNENVVGTKIASTSLDISFNNIISSCMNSDLTMQDIGRVNRWSFEETADINIYYVDNESENSTAENIYDENIRSEWFNKLRRYDGQKVDLDGFYKIYNDFYKENEILVKNFVIKKYKDSLKNLENIYPIKLKSKKDKEKKPTAGSNKLRTVNNSIYYIVRDEKKGWSDVFTEEIYYGFDKQFGESENTVNDMLRVMREIEESGDDRFDFSRILKSSKRNGATIDKIRRLARNAETPYIVFNKIYSEEFGIISKKEFINLKF